MNDLVITIRPTTEEVIVAGFPCRVWHGTTPAGLPCKLFVAKVETAPVDETRVVLPDGTEARTTLTTSYRREKKGG